jgi:hypothetical protein
MSVDINSGNWVRRWGEANGTGSTIGDERMSLLLSTSRQPAAIALLPQCSGETAVAGLPVQKKEPSIPQAHSLFATQRNSIGRVKEVARFWSAGALESLGLLSSVLFPPSRETAARWIVQGYLGRRALRESTPGILRVLWRVHSKSRASRLNLICEREVQGSFRNSKGGAS